MKVVQVLPALELGGVERGTLDIAKALVDEGHESIVISAGGRLVKQLQSEGSRHVTWDLGKKSLLTFLKLWSVRKWLRAEKPDIVHVRSRMPAWVVWLAWKGMPETDRPRFITTLHGMHSVNRYSAIMSKGEKVICVSETCRKYLFDNYEVDNPDKVTVIHRGIDEDYFVRGFQPSGEWKARFFAEYPDCIDKKLIGFPGRITRWKGHLDLVELVDLLKIQRDDFRVLVIGSEGKGSFSSELKSVIAERNLEKYFVFLGTRSDMREIYALSTVTLSLTKTTAESFGRAVVESISIGTPVVAYGYGAVAETLATLSPENLCAVGDIGMVCERLIALLDKPTCLPVNSYTLSKMRKQTIELYQNIFQESDVVRGAKS